MTQPAISAEEVVAHLRRAIRGEVAVRWETPEPPGYGSRWLGQDHDWFLIGDWRVYFFNDSGSMDYVECAESPDGRRSVYDEWAAQDADGWRDPLHLLSNDEHHALEQLLIDAG